MASIRLKGLQLSEETAIGHCPEECVEFVMTMLGSARTPIEAGPILSGAL